METQDDVDVLIVGAGISGIGTACQLREHCPDMSFQILERRQRIGGTWDLFRYPGIRSDSDMFTMGYEFRPWNELKVLADGTSIRNYVADTAREYDVADQIQFGLKVISSEFSSARGRWTVQALEESSGQRRRFEAKFLVMSTGYYRYDAGYTPDFAGISDYKGTLVHPQHWPESLDYSGKKVVVIGSGATAVTLVPSMTDKAAHVTMLQRSPTYYVNVPDEDQVARLLRRVVSDNWAGRVARQKNILRQKLLWESSRRLPGVMRKLFMSGVKAYLGKNADMSHFSPHYKPWDQRLCAVPEGDLFKAIARGDASVVTDHIDRFTENGIRLQSGRELQADIVVTATGLELETMGGASLKVDGQEKDIGKLMIHKGVMMQDIPNLAWIFGYVNSSWTLKANIAARYITRLLKHMKRVDAQVVTAVDHHGCTVDEPFLSALEANYVKRVQHRLPRQGSKDPWRNHNSYLRDRKVLLKDRIDDGVLEFSRLGESSSQLADGVAAQAA